MRVCPECGERTESKTCPADGTLTIDESVFKDKADPLIGRVLVGRYRVIELLGRGGMGRVYIAEQIAMHRQVALKVILADQASEPTSRFELVRRFQREAQASSRLEHTNTVRVFDFGHTDDGVLFLAMELLKGTTLARVVRSETCLPARRVVRIASQVCKSLSEAHGAGIVHRDMKPENIMIVPMAGEPDFVKVLDFGIAKIVNKDTDSSGITRTGMVVGTPAYMAPEQATGLPITGATDLYSLGIILYECLSGRLPFTGDTPLSVLMKHVNDPVPPIVVKGFPPGVPQELAELILDLLAKDASARPPSALEVLHRLDHLDFTRVHDGPLATVAAESFPDARVEPAMPGTAEEPAEPTVPMERGPRPPTLAEEAVTETSGEASVPGRPSRRAWSLSLAAVGLLLTLAWMFLNPGAADRDAAAPPELAPASYSEPAPATGSPPFPAAPEPVAAPPSEPPAPAAETPPAPDPVTPDQPSLASADPVPSPELPFSPEPVKRKSARVQGLKPSDPRGPTIPFCARLRCPFTQDCLNGQRKLVSGRDYCILNF